MAHEFPAPEWHDGFARHSHKQWNPAAFSFSGAAKPYSEYPSRDEAPEAHRSWLPFYAIGGVVSVAFLLTAYVISHRAEREPTPSVQVVEGSVLGAKDASAARQPHQPLALPPTVPPLPSAATTPPVVAHVPQPHHLPPVQPVTARTDSAAQSVAQERAERAAAAKASAAKSAAYAHADVGRNLASARASLDKNSLAPARRAITTALAEQPGNASALQMQAELASREQERDSLLGYARLCAREGQWVCAWHNAGHALTVDASSSEAKELLSRSIAARGAGTAREVDSGPRESDLAPRESDLAPREIGSGPPGPPIDPN